MLKQKAVVALKRKGLVRCKSATYNKPVNMYMILNVRKFHTPKLWDKSGK
jgi:hypothetical protein